MGTIKRDFKFVSYFNLVTIVISSLILLVPMVLYLQAYNTSPNTFIAAGWNQTTNLTVSLCLIGIASLVAIGIGWWWISDLKNKAYWNLSFACFKWVLITLGISAFSIISFTIAFFCIWLIPINGADSEIASLNHQRALAYIITYSCLIVLFLGCSSGCITWTNLRLSYSLSKG